MQTSVKHLHGLPKTVGSRLATAFTNRLGASHREAALALFWHVCTWTKHTDPSKRTPNHSWPKYSISTEGSEKRPVTGCPFCFTLTTASGTPRGYARHASLCALLGFGQRTWGSRLNRPSSLSSSCTHKSRWAKNQRTPRLALTTVSKAQISHKAEQPARVSACSHRLCAGCLNLNTSDGAQEHTCCWLQAVTKIASPQHTRHECVRWRWRPYGSAGPEGPSRDCFLVSNTASGLPQRSCAGQRPFGLEDTGLAVGQFGGQKTRQRQMTLPPSCSNTLFTSPRHEPKTPTPGRWLEPPRKQGRRAFQDLHHACPTEDGG